MQLTRRWTKLKDHPEQIRAFQSKKRFNVIPAGRRSGKTEIIGKRKMALRFLLCHDKKYPQYYSPYDDPKYFIAAPTRDQVKRIYWSDIKALIPKKFLLKAPNESNLIIYGINGAELHLLGLDKPERAEGSPWDHGVIDEIGNVKPGAWPENIRPALSDRRGGCDFIGVPEGRNHYYDLYCTAEEDKTGEWGAFHWVSEDILDKSEIESAKNDLDELVYQQEYCASFVNFTGQAYYNFNREIHVGSWRKYYNPKRALVICFDFNVAPGVAAIIQEFTSEIFQIPIGESVTAIIGEVYIKSQSNTIRVCEKIIQDWGRHEGMVLCYGDSTGGNSGSAQIRGSDWDLIRATLYPVFRERLQFNVPRSNPRERARVNSVNSRFLTANQKVKAVVDGKYAPNCVKDFEGVRVIEGSAGELDKKDLKLTHLSDGIGYYLAKEYPVFKFYDKAEITRIRSQNY